MYSKLVNVINSTKEEVTRDDASTEITPKPPMNAFELTSVSVGIALATLALLALYQEYNAMGRSTNIGKWHDSVFSLRNHPDTIDYFGWIAMVSTQLWPGVLATEEMAALEKTSATPVKRLITFRLHADSDYLIRPLCTTAIRVFQTCRRLALSRPFTIENTSLDLKFQAIYRPTNSHSPSRPDGPENRNYSLDGKQHRKGRSPFRFEQAKIRNRNGGAS